MKIKPVLRNRDVVYGNKDLKTIYTFKKFPVFMGVSKNHYKTDKFFRMRWQISKRSGMLQLNPLLPLNILYPETHNSGCVGKLWEKHHSEFAKFVRKLKPKKVLEIGCGVGRLGFSIADHCKEWIGCDISGNMLKHAKKRLTEKRNVKFLELDENNLSSVPDKSVDVVYCSVVFMHLEE